MSCFRESVGVSLGKGIESERSGIEAENRMMRYTSCSGSSGTVVMLERVGVRFELCRRGMQLVCWAAVRVSRSYKHAWLVVRSSAHYGFPKIMVERFVINCGAAAR